MILKKIARQYTNITVYTKFPTKLKDDFFARGAYGFGSSFYVWKNGTQKDFIVISEHSQNREHALCHELGHKLGNSLSDGTTIGMEVVAWEIGYSIYCKDFSPSPKEKELFLDRMIYCLTLYGW